MVKYRFEYPIPSARLFKNKISFFAIIFAAGLCALIVYSPSSYNILGNTPCYGYCWLLGIAGGFVIWIYEFIRRFFR